MSTPLGHDHIRYELERGLPPVALFTGPESVGKRTLARWALARHGVSQFDQLWLTRAEVSMATVRELLSRFAVEPPTEGEVKVAVVELGEETAPGVCEAMLKTLEEPPPFLRVILITGRQVPATVTSRSRVFPFGPLSVRQVTVILEAAGEDPARAAAAAAVSGGSVRAAQDALAGVSEARDRALAAVRAALAGDEESLRRAFREWGELEHRLLWQFFMEAGMQHWRAFADQAALCSERFAHRALVALSVYDVARPRLGDQAVLRRLAAGAGALG